ncbi:MAG TPA: glycosyltransferase family 9 protein [Thermoanaerobaculia bacterium]
MRLLITRLSALGDVIHALPLAASARAAGATVGWVVENVFLGALEGNPNCDRIFAADTRGWRRQPLSPATWRGLAALRAQLLAFRSDLTLDVQGLWKSAVVARSAGAPVVGFSAAARREPASAVLCGVRVTPSAEARHVVDRNLALLSAAGIRIGSRAPDASYLLARPTPEADAFLATLPRPFAVLHPGAGREDKTWGEDRFAALAASLRQRLGLASVISWGPGDAHRAERLATLAPALPKAPPLDLPGLARLCAAAALFVAGDTGPLHLADAIGTPTLALFGPTDPERNGPYRYRRGIVADMRRVTDEDVIRAAEAASVKGPL